MEEVRFCAWCGKIVNLKFHYCPWCGKNLFKSEDPDVTIDRAVQNLTRVHRNDQLASLEKMESQLGDLEEEINSIIEDRLINN